MYCQSRVNMDGLSVIIRIELSFDPKHNGAYCQLWEVFEAPAPGGNFNILNAKPVDVNSLPHDQFCQIAEELDSLIKYGVQMHYEELEGDYKDFMEHAYHDKGDN